jgi:hypothetical protein
MTIEALFHLAVIGWALVIVGYVALSIIAMPIRWARKRLS